MDNQYIPQLQTLIRSDFELLSSEFIAIRRLLTSNRDSSSHIRAFVDGSDIRLPWNAAVPALRARLAELRAQIGKEIAE